MPLLLRKLLVSGEIVGTAPSAFRVRLHTQNSTNYLSLTPYEFTSKEARDLE